MTAATALPSFEAFDLLPPSFRYQNRVRRIFLNWLTVVCSLVAILCGITAATILRLHQERLKDGRVASVAIPLIALREDVLQAQRQNSQRLQWCQRVEAARPDDDVLQTLAAIAAASHLDHRSIAVDSVQVRHSLEVPASAATTPNWATPRITITARIMPDEVAAWLERLNHSDRIDSAEIRTSRAPANLPDLNSEFHSRSGDRSRVEVVATPIASRVLP